jgi:hypothetical protein
MKALILFIGWLILFVVSWPLAVLALLFWPVVLLVSIPLAVLGIGIGALLALVKAVLFLPARLLGHKA